jgi:hypothetical protein
LDEFLVLLNHLISDIIAYILHEQVGFMNKTPAELLVALNCGGLNFVHVIAERLAVTVSLNVES